ncbi:Endopolyphosphatase [Coemansia javaensis]|uniref:Endopolyphosphatase n=1 Tax=Coemansia javaensis TaxID=2761396 RepID=A0A9W8LEQ0_9FUNG|nr:Endopolyphosphatase [Coemansia javaensis]
MDDEATALLARQHRGRRRQQQQQQERQRRWRHWGPGVWAAVAAAALATAAVVALLVGALAAGSRRTERDGGGGGGARRDAARARELAQPHVGRFIHITDLHVDRLYAEGSTTYSSCHRPPPAAAAAAAAALTGDGHRSTGRFGAALTKCDSPIALINATRDYMRAAWAGRVDFVAWTGDSGRHDRDLDQPRRFADIVDGNRVAAAAMRAAFPGVAVVPSVGNNDVSPHNELPGPGHRRARRTFRALADAWAAMVPRGQEPAFLRAGYFARDLRPRSASARGLTALSLNTMYWFRANPKVGGCRAADSPGLEHLAWLRYQMRRARERGHDLVLLGHVLPSRDNYRPSCYRGYARTVTQLAPSPPPPPPPPPPLDAASGDALALPAVHAQLFGHSNVDIWAFIGHDSPDPLPAANGSAAAAGDDRLWWEREVDEESGHFGRLIRDLWSAPGTNSTNNGSSSSPTTPPGAERAWEDMEDDDDDEDSGPPAADSAAQRKRLPSDFVDSVLGEFKQVVAQEPRNPRLAVTTISPSIIPTYYPAFRLVHYLRSPPPSKRSPWARLAPGTLLDYDVYWADLPALNRRRRKPTGPFFRPLYRFSSVYGIDSLSVDAHIEWARKLVASRTLRKRFRSLTFLGTGEQQ